MTRYGQYDPTNSENTSSLFSYQEVPLASSKMNRWNGNIAAALELFHQIGSALLAQGESGVIAVSDQTSLQTDPTDPPGMNVRILPGWAVVGRSFTGSKETVIAPEGEVFTPPQNHPRIDLVIALPTGEFETVIGAEAEPPTPPVPPSEALTLSQIYHRPGATRILSFDDGEQSFIIDSRPPFLLGKAHTHALDRIPDESPDGLRTQFSTLHFFRAGTLDVFLNGILLQNGIDYNENEDGKGYTFTSAPLSHYRIQHRYVISHERNE
ncbi:MAG: hypothetical protein C4527_24880 [Candidatus Omnitrophota bacterium]|jgi:hypothetical protein|nr:MAG: hypothetical protein C4527_24880 [Candidatus Omnitrophota bacterium]